MAKVGRPRKPSPPPEPPPRRRPGQGSISFHAPSRSWRAKLPPSVPGPIRETYHPTRAAAEAWLDGELRRYALALAAAERDRTLATLEPSSSMTLGDWLDHWFRITAPAANWTERTRAIYRDHLWYFSPVHDVPLADLTTTRLQAVVAALAESGAVRRPDSKSRKPITPLGPSSIREAVATLQRALEAARDDGLIGRNPAASVIVARVDRRKPTIWTADERRKLAPLIAADPELEALWRLLFELGLRIGEALGLQWEVVDLERGLVTIRRIVFKDGRVQEWPKGKRWRDVDLTTRALAALQRLYDSRPPGSVWVFERRKRRKGDRPWTYRGVEYPPLWSYDGIRDRLKRLCARAGVAYHPSHTGRHTHATQLLLDGVPPADAAERLGHADGSITIRLYGHPSEEGRRRALASAERSLDDGVSGRVSGEIPAEVGMEVGIRGQNGTTHSEKARSRGT